MTIRTISQLPDVQASINNDALLEVSTPVGDFRYQSQKCTFSKLQDQLGENIEVRTADKYRLKDGSYSADVHSIDTRVGQLENSDMTIKGAKTFSSIPRISSTDPDEFTIPQMVPNIQKVVDLVDGRACFVSEHYAVDAQPVKTNHSTNDTSKFLFWHFDDQTRDSSEWIDPEIGMASGPVYVNRTGWLSITGWLADNGNILAQDAWVGLFGLIYVKDENDSSIITSQWVPLQYQPWPISSKSMQRQYVSFGLPVRSGLRLKIRTGFNVNGDSGGFQTSNSIQLPLNQPNTFVGYILHTLDD